MGVRNLAVVLTGDATSLGGALRSSSAQIERFTRDAEKNNGRMATSWKNVGAAAGAAGVAIAVGLTGAGVAAAGFEARMRNVNSITALSEAAFRAQGDAVLDLSRQLPQSANTLAEGLYEIASSGFQGSRGLLVLRASAEAASAGLTSTANSATAITAVLNAYGLSASSATDVSDSLFQTVNLGVISFEALTGVIGDVAGTAAAAGVDINGVGAAIATMTLTGISAAEAGTSLNRVIQSLLQPSEGLAAVYQRLGYESGEQALKTRGLAGVMEDLRLATGGNVTALLQLFPEIRAARGALALMSNEGRTYKGVSDQIEDADRRQGATKRALAEQMKATSAQVRQAINGLRAEAIQVGLAVLPAFNDFLGIARDLGGDAMPLIESGVAAVGPLFRALAGTGANVVSVLVALAEVAAPVAGALLGMVAAPIIGGLTLLAQALEDLTGFLADNRELVIVLAAVMGGVYLVSVLRALTATVSLNLAVLRAAGGLGTFAGGAATAGAAARFAAVGIGGLAASLLALSTVATAGFVAVLATAGLAINSWQQAGRAAEAYVESTTAGFNALRPERAERTVAALRRTARESVKAADDYKGAAGTFRLGLDAIFGDADDQARKGLAAAEAANKLERQVGLAAANVRRLATDTGASEAAIVSFALKNDVDLSKPWGRLGDEISQVRDGMADLERASGTSADVMERAVGSNIEALQAFGEALAQAQEKAAQAFLGATDVVSGFDPSRGIDEQQAATRRLEDAEQRLADLRARQRAETKLDIADAQALRRAEEDVADARVEVTEASTLRSRSTLEGFYRETIAGAEQFTERLTAVTERGLDPNVVARLLREGPEKAAPLLQALAKDHSGRLIDLVNTSEERLRELNMIVVEQARLTAIAVNSATDENVRDLGTAMKVAQKVLAANGKATADAIAAQIGVPTEKVLEVARNFGITLGEEIAAGAASVPISPRVREQLYSGKVSQLQRAGLAAGGLVPGPYVGPTADNVLIRANPREYVLPVASVDHYGLGFLEALRRRAVPRFASGGLVSAGPAGAGSSVTTVTRTEHRTHSAPVYVDKVVAHDYDDFRDRLERDADLASSPGYLGGGL